MSEKAIEKKSPKCFSIHTGEAMRRYWYISLSATGLILLGAAVICFTKPYVLGPVLRYLPIAEPWFYDSYIQAVSKRHGVDFHLVKAVIKAESKFDHLAVSPKGAMGLMQIMPDTVDHMGVANPFNPEQNIDGGVRYLKWLLKVFDNDLNLALAAYNAGPNTVKRFKGVPPYAETRDYLRKVMQYYTDYKNDS